MESKLRVAKWGFGVLLVTTVLTLTHVFGYLYFEFVVPSHWYRYNTTLYRHEAFPNKEIPQHIHQVFFLQRDATIPAHFKKAQQTCLKVNYNYNYTLWDGMMVDAFIDEHYPEIKPLYNSYSRWVSRVNIARYLIIYHYGGWYMDMDTLCHKGLEDIRQAAMGKGRSAVIRPTDPTGISNDFFSASPRHPFMVDVLSALPYSNRWFIFPYATNVFSTGTTFFWGRYLNYGKPEEFYEFYEFDSYIEALHASTWHEWDGKILVYFYTHRLATYCLFGVIFSLLAFIVYALYFRFNRATNGKRFKI